MAGLRVGGCVGPQLSPLTVILTTPRLSNKKRRVSMAEAGVPSRKERLLAAIPTRNNTLGQPSDVLEVQQGTCRVSMLPTQNLLASVRGASEVAIKIQVTAGL